jgi:tetratricopeptide (TPR) repeat protein
MCALTRRHLLALAIGFLAVVALACQGGGDSSPVDDTDQEISDDELALMVLALEDFGADFADLQAVEDSGVLTLDQAAEDDFDPEDERADLERFGWASGYQEFYANPQAAEEGSGVFFVGSSVDLFETVEGAAGYFEDSSAEVLDQAGKTRNGTTVEEILTFDADIADEATGVLARFHSEDQEGSEIHFWASALVFRHGRLLGTVGIYSLEEQWFQEELRSLARQMDQNIGSILAGPAVTELTPEPPPLVAAPGAVLSTSADSFAQEVQSFRGRFTMTMGYDDSHLGMQADFAFRAPDTMHMTMAFSAEGTAVWDDIEALMILPDYYVRIPGEGWYVATAEALGLDLDLLQQYWDNRGLVDYGDLAEQLEGLAQLPDETIDGVDYLHYRGSLDYADLMQDMPEDVFDPGALEQAQDVLEPISVELWLHKETYLPRQMKLGMILNVEGSSLIMDMSMEFFDYNQPVTIPEPPLDAVPLGGILGLRCSYASQFLREKYDLPPGKGCVVLRVDANSGAERAGFQIGDKIIRLNGSPITSGRQFTYHFEELPGGPVQEFVVQRGNQELTLDVVLGIRADLPESDPYFYYLRAKSDTEVVNYSQIMADYTKAIELEPQFDLAYLYRGILQGDHGGDSEAAKADLLRALELDPELTEAHRALTRLLLQEGDFAAALAHINRSIELNGCGSLVEPWDFDCGEDLRTRSVIYLSRLEPGDDLLAEADVNAIAGVIFLEQQVALQRFRLAYLRADDDEARKMAQTLVLGSLDIPYIGGDMEREAIRAAAEADTHISDYVLGSVFYEIRVWGSYPGSAAENLYLTEFPEAPDLPDSVSALIYVVDIPGLTGDETISWELSRGPYRLGGSEIDNPFLEPFEIQFWARYALAAGRYELDVYVNGQATLTSAVDVP